MPRKNLKIAHGKLEEARLQIQNIKQQRTQLEDRVRSYTDRDIAEQAMKDVAAEYSIALKAKKPARRSPE